MPAYFCCSALAYLSLLITVAGSLTKSYSRFLSAHLSLAPFNAGPVKSLSGLWQEAQLFLNNNSPPGFAEAVCSVVLLSALLLQPNIINTVTSNTKFFIRNKL